MPAVPAKSAPVQPLPTQSILPKSLPPAPPQLPQLEPAQGTGFLSFLNNASSSSTDVAKDSNETPPATATSAARASSILSVSQDTHAVRVRMKKLMHDRSAGQKGLAGAGQERGEFEVEINVRHASMAGSSPHDHRSEADSVPHDTTYTPRESQNVHLHLHSYALAPHGITSGNSEKSFDLTSVPFQMGQAPPLPTQAGQTAGRSLMPQTPTSARQPLSPIRPSASTQAANQQSGMSASRPASVKSGRSSKRSSRRQSSLAVQALYRPLPAALAARRPSSSIAHLLQPEPKPRPFPWKQVKVSEAKRICTPRELQGIILESMREYGSASKHSLLLDRFEQIPLELEQCAQRVEQLEDAFRAETAQREGLLQRHVACLKVLNGEQGAKFAQSLVSTVSKSDRLAQESLLLREHMAKVVSVRDDHWRAVGAHQAN